MALEHSASAEQMDVKYVAALARIALTEEEAVQLQGQLNDVLAHIEELKKLDVDGVEPTANTFLEANVWREDEPADGLTQAAALANAPRARNGLFVVPKVVE